MGDLGSAVSSRLFAGVPPFVQRQMRCDDVAYIFAADCRPMGLSSFRCLQWAPKDAFCNIVHIGRSRSIR